MPRHAYTREGLPCYEVTGKNGKVRDVTIRDMREYGLLPGTTEITRERNAPFLVEWKVKQAILSVLTLPRREGESDDQFAARALEDSQAQAAVARERGQRIHHAIEDALNGRSYETEYALEVGNTLKAMYEWAGVSEGWVAEKGVASSKGYGTRVDAFHPSGFVVDFKTKEFAAEKGGKPVSPKSLSYDEHGEQLAAGGEALRDMGLLTVPSRAANIFISTKVSGLVMLREWEGEELEWAWKAFQGRLQAWQGSNRYDSTF